MNTFFLPIILSIFLGFFIGCGPTKFEANPIPKNLEIGIQPPLGNSNNSASNSGQSSQPDFSDASGNQQCDPNRPTSLISMHPVWFKNPNNPILFSEIYSVCMHGLGLAPEGNVTLAQSATVAARIDRKLFLNPNYVNRMQALGLDAAQEFLRTRKINAAVSENNGPTREIELSNGTWVHPLGGIAISFAGLTGMDHVGQFKHSIIIRDRQTGEILKGSLDPQSSIMHSITIVP